MTLFGFIWVVLVTATMLSLIADGLGVKDWCRKYRSTRQAKAIKDAARSTPKPDKEPAKESTKEPDNGFFNIHISGNVTIHTHNSHL